MLPLDKDLKNPKNDLDSFATSTIRVLNYLPNVLSDKKEKGDYLIYTSQIAGTEKYLRPINKKLVLFSEKEFKHTFQELKEIMTNLKNGKRTGYKKDAFEVIDRTLYTIQQITGAGLDLLVNPNSARKHVGNRFEELMRVIFRDIGISNKRLILKIPYETEEGEKVYKCENDLILSLLFLVYLWYTLNS